MPTTVERPPTQPIAGPARRWRRANPALVALVAVFCCTGWLGLDFGKHWDERVYLNEVRRSIIRGVPLPDMYEKASIGFDILYAHVLPTLLLDGRPAANRLLDSEGFSLRVRAFYVGLTSLTIVWTFLLVRAFRGRSGEALLAAALLGTSFEISYHSRWIAPDAATMQFTALSAMACALAWRRGLALPWLLAAAGAAALAAGTKYPGGIMLLPVAWLASRPAEGAATWRQRCLRVAAVGAVFCATFLATSPGIVFDPVRFQRDVQFVWSHYAAGQHGGYSIERGLPHAASILVYLSTQVLSPWPPAAVAFFALAGIGCFVLLRKERGLAGPLLGTAALWWIYMSLQSVMIVRNLLLLAPFLALTAAIGASTLWDRVVERRYVAVPLALALAGVLVYGAVSNMTAAHSIYAYRVPDAYTALRTHLTEHASQRFWLTPPVKIMLGNQRAEWTNVVEHPGEADWAAMRSSESVGRNEWPANRPARYESLGPRDVNFDYYPSWPGPDRIIVMRPDVHAVIASRELVRAPR